MAPGKNNYKLEYMKITDIKTPQELVTFIRQRMVTPGFEAISRHRVFGMQMPTDDDKIIFTTDNTAEGNQGLIALMADHACNAQPVGLSDLDEYGLVAVHYKNEPQLLQLYRLAEFIAIFRENLNLIDQEFIGSDMPEIMVEMAWKQARTAAKQKQKIFFTNETEISNFTSMLAHFNIASVSQPAQVEGLIQNPDTMQRLDTHVIIPDEASQALMLSLLNIASNLNRIQQSQRGLGPA